MAKGSPGSHGGRAGVNPERHNTGEGKRPCPVFKPVCRCASKAQTPGTNPSGRSPRSGPTGLSPRCRVAGRRAGQQEAVPASFIFTIALREQPRKAAASSWRRGRRFPYLPPDAPGPGRARPRLPALSVVLRAAGPQPPGAAQGSPRLEGPESPCSLRATVRHGESTHSRPPRVQTALLQPHGLCPCPAHRHPGLFQRVPVFPAVQG